jgi:hypothetical protein
MAVDLVSQLGLVASIILALIYQSWWLLAMYPALLIACGFTLVVSPATATQEAEVRRVRRLLFIFVVTLLACGAIGAFLGAG